jgi:c-di-GMP-binding flagellar brake protein YcgR
MSGAAGSSPLQVLTDAVARNVGSVLSIPSAGLVRHFPTRFLGESDEGVWVEAPADCLELIGTMVGTGSPVAISFKASTRRYSFASTVQRLEMSYQINAQTRAAAILVSRPTDLRGVQRRVAYRVRVRADDSLTVRIWSIPEHAQLQDRPLATQEIKVEPRDISTGGMGVRFICKENEPVRVVPDQRLRVLIKYGEEEMLLEGRLREVANGKLSPQSPAGIVFKKLESDLEGRRNLASLTRIVGLLQREEVRRARLGLAS